MVKGLFALAKHLTWWFIKPLVPRYCVANLTRMLQTSWSCNQTHILVASNSISLSCLEGRIYLITVLNPLPVVIILTRAFVINTHPLVGCLENSDRKVKQFHVYPGLLQVVLFTVCWYNVLHIYANVSGSAMWLRDCHAAHITLTEWIGLKCLLSHLQW